MKKSKASGFVSPNPKAIKVSQKSPEALQREISTSGQKNWAEDTILYGEDDALPLRIAQAVEESPAAGSCLDTISQFIKGSGFSNKELMKLKVDEYGTTLWALHCQLAEALAIFDGFSVNFKYNRKGSITNSFYLPFESVRFQKPLDGSREITHLKYNPYFGTAEYRQEYTKTYPVFNEQEALNQIAEDPKGFPGQVYYYGRVSPLYKFYPVPRYWRGKKWIYVDGKIQEFHSENLDNGFFQSVLLNLIGDPSAWSKNPRLQEEYDDNGTKKKRPTKTVGEEFNEQMSGTFSGAQKAGTVMALWSQKADDVVKVQAFPSNTNADLFTTLQDLTTKNITIATRVPSILANISEGVSLGSAGSEMQKAVELMQSRVAEYQNKLMEFYNEILLPNLERGTKEKVEIVNFNPITQKVEIEDKFWEFLNEQEKTEFMRKSFPGITLFRSATPTVVPATTETGEPIPEGEQPVPATPPNEALKNINQKQLDRILNIVARFNIGQVDASNKKALSFEQAKSILLGYGLTEADIPNWLITPDEV